VKYGVNEIYYTIQGEGINVGRPYVFVRFSKCNLVCDFCDTEFEATTPYTADELLAEVTRYADAAYTPPVDFEVKGARSRGSFVDRGPCRNVMFCGGEPLLQLDQPLVDAFKDAGWYIQIETNGTRPAPAGIDWIACSPKVAEHAIKLERAHELKYVRARGQGIPMPAIPADHYLISPMYDGDQPDLATIRHCIGLVMANPAWKLTAQHHKATFGNLR
jgi:7-carboxy-7-deazaguanine synthase